MNGQVVENPTTMEDDKDKLLLLQKINLQQAN